MAKLESAIQTDIIKVLESLGYFVYKHPPYPTGMPDIHAIQYGKHYWFEVKRSKVDFKKKFKNKALQKLRRKLLRKAGDVACVVWTVDHVYRAIDGFKTPKLRR